MSCGCTRAFEYRTTCPIHSHTAMTSSRFTNDSDEDDDDGDNDDNDDDDGDDDDACRSPTMRCLPTTASNTSG